jgi:hypothetical protein
MADTISNPYAFPRQLDDNHYGELGMSLRDYFAGQALVGIYAAGPGALPATANEAVYAKASYRVADAMLLARGEG